jgi:D-alanine-D-alanine ligase-like ATP-grasp enzyme
MNVPRILKILVDVSVDEVKSLFNIVKSISNAGIPHEVVLIATESSTKAKQQIIATCDKHADTLLILFERVGVHVECIIRFLFTSGYTYTGVKPDFYDHSRQTMQSNARFAGLAMPRSCVVFNSSVLEKTIVESGMSFPLFVKPENGWDSLLIDEQSKVDDYEALARQVSFVLDAYGGVRVEEFIDGREFSVLVWGDEKECFTLDPVEYDFTRIGKGAVPYLTSAHKDSDLSAGYWYEKVHDEGIIAKCREYAERLFRALNTKGYFRLDLRMRPDEGELFMLEYNSYPSVFMCAGSTLQTILQCNDRTDAFFLHEMMRFAICSGDTTQVRPTPDIKRGLGLFSTTHYNIGDVVSDCNRTSNIRILSKQSTAYNADVYRDYAYNLNADTLAIWSEDPECWKPINHSCEPNAKYVNFVTSAIRPISPNDEITVDYRTFCTDLHFECTCGSAGCRKHITCLDYNTTEYRSQFHDEDVSPYIRMLQNINNLLSIINAKTERIRVDYDRSTDSYRIVSKCDMKEGEFVMDIGNLPTGPLNNKWALTKSHCEYYTTTTSPLQYTNHSCSPNIAISSDGGHFMAHRNIAADEEITFHYNTTEYDMACPFKCVCRAARCAGLIRGFRYLSADDRCDLMMTVPCSPYIRSVSGSLILE